MPRVAAIGVAPHDVSGAPGTVERMERDEVRWLGCVVCGDDSEFIAVSPHDRVDNETIADDELMCSRCGQARLVPTLGLEAVERSA